MTTGKTIALTRQTFVGQVMSLLFNLLSRLVIAFLPRSKHLLISWLIDVYSVLNKTSAVFKAYIQIPICCGINFALGYLLVREVILIISVVDFTD